MRFTFHSFLLSTTLFAHLIGCVQSSSVNESGGDTIAGFVDSVEGMDDQPIIQPDGMIPDTEPIEKSAALTIGIAAGVLESNVIYIDQLPYIQIASQMAEMTWGIIERVDGQYLVTYINQWTGEIYGLRVTAPDNILEFIQETRLDSTDAVLSSTPGAYDGFPWSWRLPMEAGGFYMTCGYGCGYHTGTDAYATDWADGTWGHLLESPASCWVTYAGWNSWGYGYEVVGECGDAGSNRRYGFRVGHLTTTPLVTTGTWIGKGRNLGYIGDTGYASGPHVHFVVYRGTISGDYVTSGGSLPISRWPASSDSICDGDYSPYNFSGSPWYYISVKTTGCL